MGIIKKIAKVALTPSVVLGNALSNVIKKGSGKTTSEQLSNTGAGKVLGSAIALTGVGALGTALAPEAVVTSAVSGAGKILTSSVKVAGTNILNVATKNPLATTATGIFIAGGGLKLIRPATDVVRGATGFVTGTNRTSSGLGDTALLVGTGLLATRAVGTAINATTSYLNRRATRENTQAMISTIGSDAGALGSSDNMQESGVQTAETQDLEQQPISAPQNISPQPQGQKISQSVKLYVNSHNKTSKRYLKIVAV